MPEITIDTVNSDIAALAGLAREIVKAVPDIKINRTFPPTKDGVTLPVWEVVTIFIVSEVSKKLVGQITDVAIAWVKDRLNKERGPKYVSIFGPGEVPLVKKLVHRSGEVEDLLKS